MSGRKAPILAALNLALLACLLEFLQQWSAGRHPRVSDAVVGALAGHAGCSSCSAWLRKGAGAQLDFSPAQAQLNSQRLKEIERGVDKQANSG